MNIAIVIAAFNREDSLQTLLNSISNGKYGNNKVDLIISIDGGARNNTNIIKIAENFQWSYGHKNLIPHEKNIGLKNHIIFCGDLTKSYDAIILLEDDLIVAPSFYLYAKHAAEYYSSFKDIGGISLYSYEYEELGWFRFYPNHGDGDTFFMQWTSSWGQLWTKSQWENFRSWFSINESTIENINIPDNVKLWKNSWKKYYNAFLVDQNKYFVYPHVSYTTLKDGGGVHNLFDNRANSVLFTQNTNLTNYNFSKFPNETISYDAFFQPIKRSVYLKHLDKIVSLDFDLFGTKKIKNVNTEYLCSVKDISADFLGFSNLFKPYELNIFQNEIGDIFRISKTENFRDEISFLRKGKINYEMRKISLTTEMTGMIAFRFLTKLLQKMKLNVFL